MHDPYFRRAKLVRVIDGDTLELSIDLGWHIGMTARARLLGVDSPERNEVDWNAAKQVTADWLAEAETNNPDGMTIRSVKADSFGRYLVEVFSGEGPSLNEVLAARWPAKRS